MMENTCSKYIIDTNKNLHEKIEAQTEQINEYKVQNEELTEELENIEKKRNYIKGLLKNFHEMNKWNEQISVLEQKRFTTSKNFVAIYKSQANFHIRILHCLFLIVTGFLWEYSDNWHTCFVGSFLIIIASFHYSLMQNLRLCINEDVTKTIADLNKKKKELETAQDYIHEFLDNL